MYNIIKHLRNDTKHTIEQSHALKCSYDKGKPNSSSKYGWNSSKGRRSQEPHSRQTMSTEKWNEMEMRKQWIMTKNALIAKPKEVQAPKWDQTTHNK